jgi:hypothetical protein
VRFWLGTHEVSWLATAAVPLFVSHRRLMRRKRLPLAISPWALDSGGFTELNLYGRWRTEEEEYVEAVERYRDQIGQLVWAAPQDWMCEPRVLARTGLTVAEHQERTVANYLSLRSHGPFVPVLQGQHLSDYERCIELYEQAGVDLWAEPIIGLGTVCRRSRAPEIAHICTTLGSTGLRLHGFGMKSAGMARVAHLLESVDSMAWSTRARYAWQHDGLKLCGGDHHPGSCVNCSRWALRWRQKMVDGVGLFGQDWPASARSGA